MSKRKFSLLIFVAFSAIALSQITDLSSLEWKIWLDKNAQWENDELFLPPVDLSTIPTNKPTVGWKVLQQQEAQSTQLPATVEQYFWGENGNAFGVSGNYVGVSWFYTTFRAPANVKDKRVVLHFESARLRAEVYLNQKLVGYDIINGTPFTVDIADALKDGENFLAVRITDPNGNFAWRDWETYQWGKYQSVPSHGFGGITGKVSLEVTAPVYISDVFIKNKTKANSVDVEVEISNESDQATNGNIVLSIDDKAMATINVDGLKGKKVFTKTLTLKNARLWCPENPQLYTLKTEWSGQDSHYQKEQRFGFRWFEIREVNGDRMFFLNGKRVVARSAISWGHWPINGIFPTDELAIKQIKTAKSLGLNMLNFHRGIGQTKVFNAADELGLMYYEEPGGYRPGESDFVKAYKREKLLRMVKRDRNHPSLVIYSMINEAGRDPYANEKQDIRDAHQLDPTRCITFSSQFYPKKYKGGEAPKTPSEGKMFMEPYDTTVYYQGWWDEHHAGGPGVYRDYFYNGPEDYLRYTNHASEIIVWGEEGAIGSPPRLDLLKTEYQKEEKTGWDGDTYLEQHKAYDEFLSKKGFREAFPTVDDLCTQMGAISHYYQGRIIENIRIGNVTDAYIVNGWESTKVENHSGVVDIYRNPKASASILSKYNQPQYVAIKLRTKVLETGTSSIAGIYAINENGLKGTHTLKLSLQSLSGEQEIGSYKVNLKGGTNYGQLLKKAVQFNVPEEGYSELKAELLKGNKILARGCEKLYSVTTGQKTFPKIAVLDTSGYLQETLKNVAGLHFENIKTGNALDGADKGYKTLIVGGDMQPGMTPGTFRMTAPVMDWVSRGHTIIFMKNACDWAQYLNEKEILDYRGFREIDRNWFGGSYFVKAHPYFEGLPQNTVFNWEYQCLAGYDMHRVGLRLANDHCLVGVNADHNHELYSAMSVIPHGRGKVVLIALDITKALNNPHSSSVVAKKLVENILAE